MDSNPPRTHLHPLQVFFLLEEREPVAMTKLNGRATVRPRPGHLCWGLNSPGSDDITPFSKLPPGTATYYEVPPFPFPFRKAACQNHRQAQGNPLKFKLKSVADRPCESLIILHKRFCDCKDPGLWSSVFSSRCHICCWYLTVEI